MSEFNAANIQTFFKERDFGVDLSRVSLFICRPDGIVLFSKSKNSSLDESSIGALLGGVWQAASALTQFIPENSSDEGFRLSFDSSSKGIYILPLNIDDSMFYSGAIYNGEINPGLLKSKLRKMIDEIQDNFFVAPIGRQDSEEQSDFLFEDISNDEMDQLFSFAGK